MDLFVFIEQAISSYTCGIIRVCLWQTANMMTWVLMWYPTCSTYIQRHSPVAFPSASRADRGAKHQMLETFPWGKAAGLTGWGCWSQVDCLTCLMYKTLQDANAREKWESRRKSPKKSMGSFRDFVHHRNCSLLEKKLIEADVLGKDNLEMLKIMSLLDGCLVTVVTWCGKSVSPL